MDKDDSAVVLGQMAAIEYALGALMAHHADRDALLRTYRQQLGRFAMTFPDTQFAQSDQAHAQQWNALLLEHLQKTAERIETIARTTPVSG